jgi:hypothetical protein
MLAEKNTPANENRAAELAALFRLPFPPSGSELINLEVRIRNLASVDRVGCIHA